MVDSRLNLAELERQAAALERQNELEGLKLGMALAGELQARLGVTALRESHVELLLSSVANGESARA